jgi:hypothetical protein
MIALQVTGGSAQFDESVSLQADLYGKDVYVGMDMPDAFPSVFFGGLFDESGVPVPAGSLIYDYDLDRFDFSTWIVANQVKGTMGLIGPSVSEIPDSDTGVTVDGLLIKDGVAATEEALQVAFDGGGVAITTGAKGFYVCPFKMTITGWTMVADQSGSITVDVWKDTYANHPPVDADSIVTPAISSATKAQGSSLSIAVAKGDILRFNVDSATTVTMVTLALTGVRSA